MKINHLFQVLIILDRCQLCSGSGFFWGISGSNAYWNVGRCNESQAQGVKWF